MFYSDPPQTLKILLSFYFLFQDGAGALKKSVV